MSREHSIEGDVWQPRIGASCAYVFRDERSNFARAPATIVAVRPGWVLDLDVQLGDRTERHQGVHMSRSDPVANTWRLE